MHIAQAKSVTKILSCFMSRRKGPVMTPEVLSSPQELLDDGFSRLEAAEELGIKKDTLAKAIRAGKLTERSSSALKKTSFSTK